MVMAMEDQLIQMVKQDLKQLVEEDIRRFTEHYPECKEVSSIWIAEDLEIGIHNIMLHGLICDYHLHVFITREQLVEVPEYVCWVSFEDPEHEVYRRLAHVKLLFLPGRCYIESKVHDFDVHELADHLVRLAVAEERRALLEDQG